jgi:hypothetical protein
MFAEVLSGIGDALDRARIPSMVIGALVDRDVVGAVDELVVDVRDRRRPLDGIR